MRWLARTTLALAVALAPVLADAAEQDVRTLQSQLEIERSLLEAAVRARADHADRERLAATAVEAAAASVRVALARLLSPAAGTERAMTLGDAQAALTDAERALLPLLLESRAQSLLVESQALRVQALQAAVDALRARGPATPLDGTWDVVMDPGGRRGVLRLTQVGTLVTGDYAMADGSTGSLTGTFAAGRARLERVDAAAGRDSVLEGRLVARDRLEGSWLATIFGRGQAEAGTWTAQRRSDLPPPPAEDAPR